MRDAIIHCDGSPEMCRNLSGLLAHDLPALTEPALKFIMECVQELPVKTPVYATLVGLLNPKVPAFVEDVVRDAIERIEATLRSDDVSDCTRARLLLRFVALLPSVGVVEPSAAVDVLDAVVCAALAAADAAEPGWQPRADFLVYAVLAVHAVGGANPRPRRGRGHVRAPHAVRRRVPRKAPPGSRPRRHDLRLGRYGRLAGGDLGTRQRGAQGGSPERGELDRSLGTTGDDGVRGGTARGWGG